MAYPSRPLRKTSFSQQEAQGNELNTAVLDAELNQLVACFDQLASRLESITTPAGLLKNVAAATAMALNGVQVFTATASQTIFTTTIPWDTSFSSLTVTVVSQGLKLNPSLVTVANSSNVLRVTIPAQTAGNIVQVLAYSAGAGVLTRLASLSAGDGATLVAVRDLGGYWTSAEVEGALQEVGARVVALEAGDPTRWRKDGANGPATGNWNLGGHQLKGLAPGTLSTDAVNLAQLMTITNEVSSLLRGACTVFGFTMQGGIDMDSNAIENLPAPVQDGDAANKRYVLDAVAGAVPDLSGYFKRDGTAPPTANTSWNGFQINGLANGTNSVDAVNKRQLDAVESGAIAVNGSRPPSANISWNNKKITDLAAGTNGTDAAQIGQVITRDGLNYPLADTNWGGKKITNLANGVSTQDAATLVQAADSLLGRISFLRTTSAVAHFPVTISELQELHLAGTQTVTQTGVVPSIQVSRAAAAAILTVRTELLLVESVQVNMFMFYLNIWRIRGGGYSTFSENPSGVFIPSELFGVIEMSVLVPDVQVGDAFAVGVGLPVGVAERQTRHSLLLRSHTYY